MVSLRAATDSSIKGKRGEALVRLMFELHGCRVIAFGVEAHFPELRARQLHERGASERLRALPDLVVARETNESKLLTTFVEVKTHREPPADDQLLHYSMYDKVAVVWVGPQGIRYKWVMDGEVKPAWEPITKLGILEAQPRLLDPLDQLCREIHSRETSVVLT